MSLVGTRPPTVDEWEKYELHHRSRMSIKPGITGMWQVSGRSDITDFEEVVKLDTEYIEKPEAFVDWIYWKLGDKIADDYMIPYNQKMFNKELNQLGTYWLEKLPNVSFEETLLSCLQKKAYGTQPGHWLKGVSYRKREVKIL